MELKLTAQREGDTGSLSSCSDRCPLLWVRPSTSAVRLSYCLDCTWSPVLALGFSRERTCFSLEPQRTDAFVHAQRQFDPEGRFSSRQGYRETGQIFPPLFTLRGQIPHLEGAM